MVKALVLGCSGFIGRNLVKFLVDEGTCTMIRGVDKVLLQTAFLGKEHQEAFANPKVEFKQGNLTSDVSIAKCFALEDGSAFDIVFNVSGETKYGQTEEVYKEKVLDLSVKCGKEAAKTGVKKFIEVSTAQVYDAGSKASKEDGKLEPWTTIAKFKLEAEKELAKIAGLNVIIVRPAVVYGPGDTSGLSPRLICGRVYKHLDSTMKFLHGEHMRINTVHVRDVVKALWVIANKGTVGEVYNLADKADSDQDSISKLIGEIFGIKTGYQGTIVSTLAKAAMGSVTEQVNDKHLPPWSEICKQHNITNTPLTPYLDKELLYNNSLACDGSKVEALGFSYQYPSPTVDLLKEQLNYYVRQNLFPPSDKGDW